MGKQTARTAVIVFFIFSVFLSACSAPKSYPEKDRGSEAARLLGGPQWYRHAVFYEIYVRSFQDSNGDGIGDLPGLISRLDYLKDLGIDALWLMPIMASPFADSGYDVSDYYEINSDYGTIADVDALLEAAHARGIRVFLDLVINHTSVQHAWFQESSSSRDNPKADWYIWSDTPGRADIGCGPVTTFGTNAWVYEPRRNQYYFHRFYPFQADLNYRNPDVVAATLAVVQFWLDRGVDGFRCDAIGLLYESAASCEVIPETTEYFKKLRSLVDTYPNRAMVAENFSFEGAAPYFGNGQNMFHMAFDFIYGSGWSSFFAAGLPTLFGNHFNIVQESYPTGAQNAIFIGTHDFPRAYKRTDGIVSRARRAALMQMTMPGTPFIYYGEELALQPGKEQSVDSRDEARTPMLWDTSSGWGFTTAQPWINFGAKPEETNLAYEKTAAASNYAFYRELLQLRRGREAFGGGSLRILYTDQASIFIYERASSYETYIVALNLDETNEVSAIVAAVDLSSDPVRLFGDATLTRSGNATRVIVPPAGMGVFRVR